MNEFLQDKQFLFQLDNLHNKKKYLKMILMDFQENAICEIQGRAVSGTVNVDGNSSVRRTCNFAMVFKTEEVSDPINFENYVAPNRKFQLYIGLENPFPEYQQYGEIVWFNLGLYIISTYSLSYSTQGVNITIAAQDKMCMLNGSVGGTLPASTIFHEKYTYNNDDTITIEYPSIVQIIREAVNHFGEEALNKIIISDLDENVRVLVDYVGENPIYFNETYSDYSFTPSDRFFHKYENGDPVGYFWETFTYPGELTLSAGETVVNLLDKITAVLGNYEYFYDLDGNFRFQEQKNYLNTSYTPIVDLNGETYFRYFNETPAEYSFKSSQILTAISKSPNLNNIKNDFIVWGTHETASGATVGMRYHVAIDTKPETDGSLDWREMIYREIMRDYTEGTSTSRYNYYQAEMVAEWRNLYCPSLVADEENFVTQEQAETALEWRNKWNELYPDTTWYGWNPDVFNAPENLNYYLDFIDSTAEVGKYSVSNIGRRSYVVNDSDVTSIYNKENPDVVFIEASRADDREYLYGLGYTNIFQFTGELSDLFRVSYQGKSCYDVIREALYQYVSTNESISITCLPIYYLEPNTLIEVQEPNADTYGNFIVSSFTIPLDPISTMSISASKAMMRV